MLIEVSRRAKEPQTNALPFWHEALKRAVSQKADGVLFPAGEYHFYPAGTFRKYCVISNNDEGVKSIALYLRGLSGFTLKGENSLLIFHGRISPLVAEYCRDLQIEGIRIDFADSFVHEAEALDCTPEGTWFRFGGKYRIGGDRLHFFPDALDNLDGRLRLFAFDREHGDFPSDAKIFFAPNRILRREPDRILLSVDVSGSSQSFFTVRHQGRYNPGIVIDSCRDVRIRNCTVHHCGGMGLIAQTTENICLDGMKVVPGSGRLVASSDDALHFSECSGRIELRGAVLNNTLDDALNIHGIYRRLHNRGGTFVVENGQYQQFGLCPGKAGDRIEFSKRDTMQAYAVLRVKSFSEVNRQICCVEFEEPLPPEFEDGDMIRNLKTAEAEVLVSGCEIARNHPRGILVSGVKKAVIENNYIHSPRSGVYISGDMNFWYESGPIRETLIRGNTFDRCCYVNSAAANHAPITFAPEIPRLLPGFHYHGSVRIESNTFCLNHSGPPLRALSVETLELANNRITGAEAAPVQLRHCGKIE